MLKSQPKNLLIIDHELKIEPFQDYFEKFGYEITHRIAFPVQRELNAADAIIIHCSLVPEQVSATILALYENKIIPILAINDCKNDDICVKILESGADDFLVKPICPRELHARMNAIYRRIQWGNKQQQEKEVLIFSNWQLYPDSRQLFNKQQKEQFLSPREYDLLILFVRYPQQILDREFLIQHLEGNEFNPLNRRIDVQVSRLRQKIEENAQKPQLIKTIRSEGYLFTSPVLSRKERDCCENEPIF